MPAKKILVVEDNKDLLLATRLCLQDAGYIAIGACDSVSCIKLAVEEKPDLILLDLGLPDNDGFTVMGLLSQIGSTAPIPVIVMSARPYQFYKEASLFAGARNYFEKPLDNTLLIEAIESALASTESAVNWNRRSTRSV